MRISIGIPLTRFIIKFVCNIFRCDEYLASCTRRKHVNSCRSLGKVAFYFFPIFLILESTNNTDQPPESFGNEVSSLCKFWDGECAYGVENV